MASMNNRNRREYMNNRNIRPQNRYTSSTNYQMPMQQSASLQGDIPPIQEDYPHNNSSISNNHLNSSNERRQPIRHTETKEVVSSNNSDIDVSSQESVNKTQHINTSSQTRSKQNNGNIFGNFNKSIGGVNPLSSISGFLKDKNISLDRDKLILIFLIYLLYKEDKEKDNVKLLIALAYILL